MALMKNCCCCISPRNGAITIAALYLISTVLSIIMTGLAAFSGIAVHPSAVTVFLITFIVLCIYCSFCVVLLIGAIKEIPVLMLLWLIVDFLRVLLCIIVFIALPIASEVSSLPAHIVVGLIGIIVSVYFWLCIVSARQHVVEGTRGVTFSKP